MYQPVDLQALEEKAQSMRLDILDITTRAASGHVSSSYSAMEILTAFYFGGPDMAGILRYRPDEPRWPEQDRFIISKGHAAPLLCTVLAHDGYGSFSAHIEAIAAAAAIWRPLAPTQDALGQNGLAFLQKTFP